MNLDTINKIRKYAWYATMPIPRPIKSPLRAMMHKRFEFWAFRQMQRNNELIPLVSWDETRFFSDADPSKHFDAHYVYHTGWAARKLVELAPTEHFDFSSSLYFSSIVSAFIPVTFLDYRPAAINLAGFKGQPCDLVNLSIPDCSYESVSCMHVIEHIGLGRYGDELNVNGDRMACDELQRITVPGGSLLIVVPVGKSRIEFNAHRIYEFEQILSMFSGCDLLSNALLPDDSDCGLQYNAAPSDFNKQRYGCGCFEFRKKR